MADPYILTRQRRTTRNMNSPLDQLIDLTRALGHPAMDYVIIGEGNTSMTVDAEAFAIKASGQRMREIAADGFITVPFAPYLAWLDNPDAPAPDLTQPGGLRPSIEASFHAMLLHDCGVNFIGHTHPTAVNQILCSPFAADFARQRRFPDEVVLCGPESLLLPYADPGLPLAQLMRPRLRQFRERQGEAPKLILLQNHGLIALGDSPAEILNITAMAVKSARIYLGARQLGGVVSLPESEVCHLYGRPDEIYRRQRFVDEDGAE